MAHLLTQKETYSFMNAMVEDMTGQQNTIRAVDTSSFIDCGELVLSMGYENVLNKLGLLMGRIFTAVRPFSEEFNLINAISTDIFTHRMEKISYYSKKALPSGAWNTDVFTNLAEGFTNGENVDATSGDAQSTKSMWEQHYGKPVVEYFSGSDVYDHCISIPEVQLQQAFRSENEFNEFISGILMQHENDITLVKNAFRRATVLNYMAGIYDMEAASLMPGSVVNLTAGFNARYGTAYTTAQLLSTYYKEFLSYFVATVKKYQRRLKNPSTKYHWTPANDENLPLLRATERADQKLFLLNEFYTDAEAMVLPEIFNDEELKVQFEGIEYWQNENEPSKIKITPAIPTGTNGTWAKGTEVALNYVVGCLFDKDACMTDFQLERAESTPLEARKLYRSIWLHIAKNGINSFTEKGVLFIMADPVTTNNSVGSTRSKK